MGTDAARHPARRQRARSTRRRPRGPGREASPGRERGEGGESAKEWQEKSLGVRETEEHTQTYQTRIVNVIC